MKVRMPTALRALIPEPLGTCMADSHPTNAHPTKTGTTGDSNAPGKPAAERPGSAQPRHLTALTRPQPTTATLGAGPSSTRPGGATWALPASATIAAVARANAAGELGALGLDGALTRTLTTSDVLVMVSELATNAYQHTAVCQDGRLQPGGGAELWMYRQVTVRGRQELMVAVFDRSSEPPRSALRAVPGREAEHGRGLMLVEAMSQGRCGSYRTRSRLTNLPGKVTWFAVPLPDTGPDHTAMWERDAVAACKVLKGLLATRGFGSLLLRSYPESQLAVLSVTTGLTVWCQGGRFRWGTRRKIPIANVTAVAEEIVRLHETATRPGSSPA